MPARSPKPRKECWYCGKPAAGRHMYCATCLRRIERTGCVDLDEYPTQADSDRAWAPDLRSLV